eukprot:scaffold5395_cov126-Cylindrotheca_fusiformis.AAC.18
MESETNIHLHTHAPYVDCVGNYWESTGDVTMISSVADQGVQTIVSFCNLASQILDGGFIIRT